MLALEPMSCCAREAERRHLDVNATADDLLTEHPSATPTGLAELDRTLDRAAKLRATLPRTDDAVSLVREGRDELDRRTHSCGESRHRRQRPRRVRRQRETSPEHRSTTPPVGCRKHAATRTDPRPV